MQFIDLKKQYLKFKSEIDQQIKKVLDHGQYIMGPEVFELEDNLADFVSTKHAISCGSGTDALLMSLMALDVKPGDYVLTTPFTYIATAEVISLVGAIPVFIDIDPNEAQKRKDQEEDRIERAGIDLQNRVRSAYVSLAKRFNHRYVSINGDDSIESIHNAIIDKMKKKNLIK